MAWTAPMTAVENVIWTSSQFNSGVRDNLLETAPAKATTGSQIFVATGANAIAARSIPTSASVATLETTSAGVYTDLATSGPALTVTTGTRAIVAFKCKMSRDIADVSVRVSVAVSGATTIAASDDWNILPDGRPANESVSMGVAHLFTGLTPGSNTFTMKYISGATGSFSERYLSVIPL